MSDNTPHQHKPGTVETTGHAWDENLREYNNPLPRWWLWCFYGTVVFAIIYWLIYPSWPVGKTWLKGFYTVDYTITNKATGKEETRNSRWNTRAELLSDLHAAENDPQRKAMLDKVQAASGEEIAKDPQMMAFVRSVGKGLFGDNCAACHGQGAQGVIGLFPNLADDDWLWGGSVDTITETISGGRSGMMPAFEAVLQPEQRLDVAEYVLTLSNDTPTSEASGRGKDIFEGAGGCFACHGADGKGMAALGAANLTDKIWTLVNVPALKTLDEKKTALAAYIAKGVNNTRVMPAWKDRLSPLEIKLLAVYVHQLGGGAK